MLRGFQVCGILYSAYQHTFSVQRLLCYAKLSKLIDVSIQRLQMLCQQRADIKQKIGYAKECLFTVQVTEKGVEFSALCVVYSVLCVLSYLFYTKHTITGAVCFIRKRQGAGSWVSHHIAFFPQLPHDTGHGNGHHTAFVWGNHLDASYRQHPPSWFFLSREYLFVDKKLLGFCILLLLILLLLLCVFFHCFVLSVKCYFKP